VQDSTPKVDLVPTQVAQLSGAKAMAVSHENYGRVAVAVAVAASGLDQPLDLAGRDMLAGADLAVLGPPRRNCSHYASWRDQFEMQILHGNPAFVRETVSTFDEIRTVDKDRRGGESK
jgi:hypothetical protein